MMHPLQLRVAWWLPVAGAVWAWTMTLAASGGWRWSTVIFCGGAGIYLGRWIDRENRG